MKIIIKIIQKVDDSYLIENQIMVANSFLPITGLNDEISKLLYGTFPEKSKSNFTFEFTLQSDPDTRDEPFYYQAELIDVLTETLKGSEASNINLTKVQEVLRLKYLVSFLLEPDDFFQNKNGNNSLKSIEKKPEFFSSFYEDFDLIINRKDQPFLEKNGCAMSLLKPKILEIINLIYLSPPKISIERIYKSSYQFIQLFQYEEKRLNECKKLDEIGQKEINYIFDSLLSFLKIYYKKLISNESNPELSEREDKKAIIGIHQVLQKSLASFKGKLSSQQNKNLKSFFLALSDGGMPQKEKIKQEIDIDMEKPVEKSSRKQEDSRLTVIWELFLRNYLHSSILEKVKK